MKVVMSPRSLERGAETCRTIVGEVDRVADRVTSLPHPEGMPGAAVAELSSIVAALGRSSRSTTAQARWLEHRARLGFLADSPFGSLFDFGAPPLLSPWDMPAAPPSKKPERSGWSKFWGDVGDVGSNIGNYGIGLGEGLYGLGKGAVETVAVGGAHLIDSATGLPISDHIPWVGGLRRDFDAGVEWASKHPKEFAELMKDDLLAEDEDDDAQRAGKITVEIAGLVVTITKLAKLGKLARLGKVPEAKEPEAPKPQPKGPPGVQVSVPGPVSDRLPDSWGDGEVTKKGGGIRWHDPANPKGTGVRIDPGNPSSPYPSQQVDHVVVRKDGHVLGRDGKPIDGSIKQDPENAHIPLSEYEKWDSWDHP